MFTRDMDNLSVAIRHGEITRDQALAELREKGHNVNHAAIARFCEFTGITAREFWAIYESYRNLAIWRRDGNGRWYVPEFLVQNFDWGF